MSKYDHIQSFNDFDKEIHKLNKKLDYSKLRVELLQNQIRYKTSPAALVSHVVNNISSTAINRIKQYLKENLNIKL